jgi:5-methylcytosine-specific restriction endonuclease McrBC GTP-binding regulatory subunit McrB
MAFFMNQYGEVFNELGLPAREEWEEYLKKRSEKQEEFDRKYWKEVENHSSTKRDICANCGKPIYSSENDYGYWQHEHSKTGCCKWAEPKFYKPEPVVFKDYTVQEVLDSIKAPENLELPEFMKRSN